MILEKKRQKRVHMARIVFFFGSYARGTARDDNDVDLRIDRGQIKGWALGGLMVDQEQSFGKRVDLLTTGNLDQEFLTAIKDEEVLLYEHNV